MDQNQTNPTNPANPFDAINDLSFELMINDLAFLIKKYGHQELINKVFTKDENYFSVADNIQFLTHLFVIKFWPPDKSVTLDQTKKEYIVNFIATANPASSPEQIAVGLKKIDPNLILMNNFNLPEAQKRAKELLLGINNLKSLLMDLFAPDYLLDTKNFYRMSSDKLEKFYQEITSISEDIQTGYQKLLKKEFVLEDKQQMVQRITSLFHAIGRTDFFVAIEKESANIGELSDLIMKLQVGVKAASALKKMNLGNQDITPFALEEIKKILKTEMKI